MSEEESDTLEKRRTTKKKDDDGRENNSNSMKVLKQMKRDKHKIDWLRDNIIWFIIPLVILAGLGGLLFARWVAFPY